MTSIKTYLFALAFVAVVSIAVGHSYEKKLFLKKRQAPDPAAPPAAGAGNVTIPKAEVPLTTAAPGGGSTMAPKSGASFLTPLTIAIATAGFLVSRMAVFGDI